MKSRREQIEEAFKIQPVTAGEVNLTSYLYNDAKNRHELLEEFQKFKTLMLIFGAEWADENPRVYLKK